MSEADAGEDEGDQIASSYGSRPASAGARSPRLDWSVLPVRQHVPSHFGEPEHEWKDENPWPSVPDLPDLSDHNTCQNQGAPPSESAAAKVRAETLTRIMEGRPNGVAVGAGARQLAHRAGHESISDRQDHANYRLT